MRLSVKYRHYYHHHTTFQNSVPRQLAFYSFGSCGSTQDCAILNDIGYIVSSTFNETKSLPISFR